MDNPQASPEAVECVVMPQWAAVPSLTYPPCCKHARCSWEIVSESWNSHWNSQTSRGSYHAISWLTPLFVSLSTSLLSASSSPDLCHSLWMMTWSSSQVIPRTGWASRFELTQTHSFGCPRGSLNLLYLHSKEAVTLLDWVLVKVFDRFEFGLENFNKKSTPDSSYARASQ